MRPRTNDAFSAMESVSLQRALAVGMPEPQIVPTSVYSGNHYITPEM